MCKYVVAVYMVDRAYGGHEEGGWWFDYGELVRTMRVFTNEEKAVSYCRRMNDLLHITLNKGRREISSVLSEGQYAAEIWDNHAPKYYPDCKPHYE